MMLSLDSNVIFVAINVDDGLRERALEALHQNQAEGYCICPPVYAELRADPEWSTVVKPFIETTGIVIDWNMPQAVWESAGVFSRRYADLRKGGKLPRRILADFLIAAHAEQHGLDIMSFDETVYKVVLEKSKLLVP